MAPISRSVRRKRVADTTLARRIRLGEDTSLELKGVTFESDRIRGPRRDGLADEIAAFANGRGGTLVFGVDDRTRLMDRRGDGVPIIRRRSLDLSGRLPEYSVIDDGELRLVIWAAQP